MIDGMEREAKTIREQSLKMSWHMRGGVSYEDVMNMSLHERQAIADLIKENMETTNKTKLPFF